MPSCDTNKSGFAILHFSLGNAYVQLKLYDVVVSSYNRAFTINSDLCLFYN